MIQQLRKGAQLGFLFIQFCIKQLITEPTHILENSSSWNVLFFTNLPLLF